MSNPASFDVRIVRRPDRRQDEERRAQSRGGRRASDQPAFELSSSAKADDSWIPAGASDRHSTPGKIYVH